MFNTQTTFIKTQHILHGSDKNGKKKNLILACLKILPLNVSEFVLQLQIGNGSYTWS